MNFRIFIWAVLLSTLASTGICQTLQPTRDKALIQMLILDPKDQPLSEKIQLEAASTGTIYTTTSNRRIADTRWRHLHPPHEI